MREIPLVSVLMTAYNREKYIAEAIESVLASTYTNFELIIVDDCSIDKTVEIARSYEMRDERIKVYVNERNLGDYPNRNKAAKYAKGKFLKYLDSDDLIYAHGLAAFVYNMEELPKAALGISSRNIQQDIPFPILISKEDAIRRHFFKDGFLDCGPSGVIIKREVFERFGGFSGKRMIGDSELWFKIASQHPVAIVPPSLIFWRRHDKQEFFQVLTPASIWK
ncbi:MAG: glycosyltransferase family A protein [Segetibacter sp.]